jgi:hypothetical protein
MEGNCRKKEEKREDNGLRAKSTKTTKKGRVNGREL